MIPDTIEVPLRVLDRLKEALNDGLDGCANALAHGYHDPDGTLEYGIGAMNGALEELDNLTWPRPIPKGNL